MTLRHCSGRTLHIEKLKTDTRKNGARKIPKSYVNTIELTELIALIA